MSDSAEYPRKRDSRDNAPRERDSRDSRPAHDNAPRDRDSRDSRDRDSRDSRPPRDRDSRDSRDRDSRDSRPPRDRDSRDSRDRDSRDSRPPRDRDSRDSRDRDSRDSRPPRDRDARDSRDRDSRDSRPPRDRDSRDSRDRDSRDSRPPRDRDSRDRKDFSRDNRDHGDGKDRKDFKDRRDFNDRGPRDRDSCDGAPRKGVMDLLREADTEIIRMVARRTRLREKLSDRNSGAKERDLRTAWEEAASRVSRDPQFLRDLFSLLQQVSVNPADSDYTQAFNLAPTAQPVRVNLPVPASTRQTRLLMTLAAASGSACTLSNALLNTQVIACLKMFTQAGASLRWEETPDRVECASAEPITGATKPILDKVIHVGDDILNFHLLLFLMLTRPTRLKFMGENALRNLDLAPLRHFLPVLGGRLTSVIPGEDGLPARLESSALLPDNVVVPAELAEEAVLGLLMSTPFWPHKVRVDLSENLTPTVEVLDLLRACGATVEDTGALLTITPPATFAMPESHSDMDLLTAFPLLAFAGCTGGTATVQGGWPVRHPLAAPALSLLKTISHISVEVDSVQARAFTPEEAAALPAPVPDLSTVPAPLIGPALALYLQKKRRETTCAMPQLPVGIDPLMVDGFLAALGYELDGETLNRTEPSKVPWAAPSPWWGLALALAAFSFPHLRLANPAMVTAQIPLFWIMYNSLPEPSAQRKPAEQEEIAPAAPGRRRVLAGFMPESELPPALDHYIDED